MELLRITIDSPRNVFHLYVNEDLPSGRVTADLDIGINGRLLSLSLPFGELDITQPMPEDTSLSRSVSVQVTVGDGVITLPRRGPGWEIVYPFGNECWQLHLPDGTARVICATRVDSPSVSDDSAAE